MEKKLSKDVGPMLHNVSAFSANLHTDDTKYQQFYNSYADSLSGFPGIWMFCAHAGYAFTYVERQRNLTWDDGKLKNANFDTTQGFGLRAVIHPDDDVAVGVVAMLDSIITPTSDLLPRRT